MFFGRHDQASFLGLMTRGVVLGAGAHQSRSASKQKKNLTRRSLVRTTLNPFGLISSDCLVFGIRVPVGDLIYSEFSSRTLTGGFLDPRLNGQKTYNVVMESVFSHASPIK